MHHKEILKHYGIRAQKSLGQNFLVNDEILEAIADSIDITGQDILEIGPGYGALTEKILARKPRSLTLVELDKQMVYILNSRIHEREIVIPKETTFRIIEGDVLQYVPPLTLSPSEEREIYSVIANIPYYITSPILFRFLHELESKPNEMVILMQKEVGDKICRKKWYPHSYLSLALEFSCESIEEVCLVAKENFIPAPKIDSSVLYFQRRAEYNRINAKDFLRITSAWFSAPRKKVISNLASTLHISKESLASDFQALGLLDTVRAEEINLITWNKIIEKIEKKWEL